LEYWSDGVFASGVMEYWSNGIMGKTKEENI
jgi:hypothetical protein